MIVLSQRTRILIVDSAVLREKEYVQMLSCRWARAQRVSSYLNYRVRSDDEISSHESYLTSTAVERFEFPYPFGCRVAEALPISSILVRSYGDTLPELPPCSFVWNHGYQALPFVSIQGAWIRK
jgi:hypothetical protein